MRIETPASRSTDPTTSHIAEAQHTASGKRHSHHAIISLHVKVCPGRTAAEMGVLTGLGQITCARRLPELDGITVRRGARRKCAEKGTMMQTWFPNLDYWEAKRYGVATDLNKCSDRFIVVDDKNEKRK